MVSAPSGVREISVPRHQIVTVSFFDVPILKDCSLGNSIVEDRCDVDVLDLVVVLVASGSNLNSSDKDVLKFSSFVLGSDSIKQSSKVFVLLDIESSIPLAVFVMEWYCSYTCAGHGKMANELWWFRPCGQAVQKYPVVLRNRLLELDKINLVTFYKPILLERIGWIVGPVRVPPQLSKLVNLSESALSITCHYSIFRLPRKHV